MRWTTILILFFIAVLAAGCGDYGTCVEDPPDSSLFYPLDIGNMWTYRSSYARGFYDADSGAAIRTDTTEAVWGVSLTGSERIGGVEYIVETTVVTVDTNPDTTWVRLRQDVDGLYRADISRRLRPGSAAITAITDPPSERVRLQYPLEAGVRWDVVPGTGPVTATVEQADTLATPAGSLESWRIRINTPLDGPSDRHHVWHSRQGKIQEEQYTEFIAIDDFTGERIRIVIDSRLYLLGFFFPEQHLISAEKSVK